MSSGVNKKLIQELRDLTGLGLADCKNALDQTGGDLTKAIELLRKKGTAVAAKRSGKSTAEGLVQAYIHPGSQVGVLVEINCETDFVARTAGIQQFAADLCLHIAAMKPLYLRPEDVDPKFLEHEKEILGEQLKQTGKPEKIIEQILEGKVAKLYSDICLMKQPYVKNDQLTIEDLVTELIAKTGENVIIRRFARYEVGV